MLYPSSFMLPPHIFSLKAFSNRLFRHPSIRPSNTRATNSYGNRNKRVKKGGEGSQKRKEKEKEKEKKEKEKEVKTKEERGRRKRRRRRRRRRKEGEDKKKKDSVCSHEPRPRHCR